MHAHYPEQILAGVSPQHPNAEQHTVAHLAYQTVTVAAMLLFLLSFWSC